MSKSVLMLLENPFISDGRVEREISTIIKAGYNVVLVCWDRETEIFRKRISV